MIEKTHKQRGQAAKVTFSIPVDWVDRAASVVGDFNDWDPAATPLRKRGSVRTASVMLAAGRSYRFRYVDTDGHWYDDPEPDTMVPNGFGGADCVVDLP
ncbi:MAG: isoamylase early set domain-containing protein [Acidimicrobiales bacterium]